jgi:hypothetical protein
VDVLEARTCPRIILQEARDILKNTVFGSKQVYEAEQGQNQAIARIIPSTVYV